MKIRSARASASNEHRRTAEDIETPPVQGERDATASIGRSQSTMFLIAELLSEPGTRRSAIRSLTCLSSAAEPHSRVVHRESPVTRNGRLLLKTTRNSI